jgi:hypothetical protein
MKSFISSAIAFGTVAVIACAVVLGNATNATAEKVTAQRIVDAAIGNTVFETTNSGIRNKVFLQEGGRIVVNGENGFFDEGQWEIRDGKLCQQFAKIQRGQQFCFRDFDMEGNMFTAFNEVRNGRQPFRIYSGIASGFEDVKK